MKDNQEILRQYVSDMMSVEKHTLEALERQTGDRRVMEYKDAHELLMRIQATLRNHVTALDIYLASVPPVQTSKAENAEAMIKKAATGAMGTIAGLYSRLRTDDPISRNLRDDYTSLSLAAISYTMLHTTAHALHDTRVADLALAHLNDITPFVAALSRIIPHVVARELAVEGKALDVAVGQEAVDNTQKAWSHEVIG